MTQTCPSCSQQLLVNTKSCAYCGAELPSQSTFSPGNPSRPLPPWSIDIDLNNQAQQVPQQNIVTMPQTTMMGIPQMIPGQAGGALFGQQGQYLMHTQKPMMSFTEAIKSCFHNYANTSGRAQRSEYWWFQLFNFSLVIGFMIFTPQILGDSNLSLDRLIALFSIFFVAFLTLIPTLSVTGRRLHDIGWSAWYILLIFLPFNIGSLILIIACLMPSQPHPNKYGV